MGFTPDDEERHCCGKSYVVRLWSTGGFPPVWYSYWSHWVRGVRAPRVGFTWFMYPRAKLCSVRTMVCVKCSTTHPCRRNWSLLTMEVNRKNKFGENNSLYWWPTIIWGSQGLASVGISVGLIVQWWVMLGYVVTPVESPGRPIKRNWYWEARKRNQ